MKTDRDFLGHSFLFLWTLVFTAIDFYKIDTEVGANPIEIMIVIAICGVLYYISGLIVWVVGKAIYNKLQ